MNKKTIIISIVIALLLYCSLFLISRTIPSNGIFMCGEYQATFSYSTHLRALWNGTDFANPTRLFSCPGCILFHQHSWLYSLVSLSYLSIGERIYLNSFVFYIASGIIIQIISVWVFIRYGLNKPKQNFFITILLSGILITPVYKTQLLCSGTSYAINHSLTLLILTYFLYLIRIREPKLKPSKVIALSMVANILLIATLTIGIVYLPILLYMVIVVIVFNIKDIYASISNLAKIISLSLFIFLSVNIRWIINLTSDVFNKTYLAPVNNETFLDAVTGRYFISLNIHPSVPIIFCIFLLLTIVVHIYYKFKSIILLLLAYVFMVILLMGSNSPYNLYLFIFDNFPLMSSIRSSHRLYAFILIFQIILTYTAIETLRGKLKAAYIALFSLVMLLNIYTSVKLLQQHMIFTTFPEGYTEVVEYIEENYPNESVLYLPINSSSYLYRNYEWYDQLKSIHNPYVYIDLMQSLFYLDNNIQIFNWYNYEPNDYHLNRLTNLYIFESELASINFSKRIEKISPILIIDDHYHLKREEYNNLLLENYQEIKTFEKIKLYKRVAKIDCEKYYGNTIIGQENVCFDYYNPTFLNNKTIQEFIFETKPSKNWESGQLVRSDMVHSELIYSQNARTHLTNRAIIFNTDTIEIVNAENEYEPTEFQQFSSPINNGYLLFEGIHIPTESVEFSEIIVKQGNFTKSIVLNNPSKFTLYTVPLEHKGAETIEMLAKGKYILLTRPKLLSELEYSEFQISSQNLIPQKGQPN